jgi:hypothetical protein
MWRWWATLPLSCLWGASKAPPFLTLSLHYFNHLGGLGWLWAWPFFYRVAPYNYYFTTLWLSLDLLPSSVGFGRLGKATATEIEHCVWSGQQLISSSGLGMMPRRTNIILLFLILANFLYIIIFLGFLVSIFFLQLFMKSYMGAYKLDMETKNT